MKTPRLHHLLLLTGLFWLAACSNAHDTAELHVDNLKLTLLQSGARILTGELVNDTETAVQHAQIQISLFDAQNQRISSMSVEVRDVDPQTSKRFREPIQIDLDVQGASVRNILVF